MIRALLDFLKEGAALVALSAFVAGLILWAEILHFLLEH
jgi:hypothetical protein